MAPGSGGWDIQDGPAWRSGSGEGLLLLADGRLLAGAFTGLRERSLLEGHKSHPGPHPCDPAQRLSLAQTPPANTIPWDVGLQHMSLCGRDTNLQSLTQKSLECVHFNDNLMFVQP